MELMCGACTSENGRAIALDGGRPHVDYTHETVTYANTFPGRVDPMDNDLYRREVIALRRLERPTFFGRAA
ncbi:MAG TPA: hypothetical protein VFM71_00600 [Gemmatimonadaceae bacterium]|nr:hypothetical protein [Gemmatimonadaceae bacterium]